MMETIIITWKKNPHINGSLLLLIAADKIRIVHALQWSDMNRENGQPEWKLKITLHRIPTKNVYNLLRTYSDWMAVLIDVTGLLGWTVDWFPNENGFVLGVTADGEENWLLVVFELKELPVVWGGNWLPNGPAIWPISEANTWVEYTQKDINNQ